MDPIWRLPFTDLFGTVLTHQDPTDKCADFEMRLVQCLEAYGYPMGYKKCKDYMDDLKECGTHAKQLARMQAMQKERERQIKAGERKKEDKWCAPPKPESYYDFK